MTTNNRPQGTAQVCPTANTTYTLTGHKRDEQQAGDGEPHGVGECGSAVSASITGSTAVPTNITRGESSTLQWAVDGANTVTLNGQSVQSNGSQVVSPTQTTTYTLVATGTDGRAVNATAVVTVSAGEVPRILQFALNPATIEAGGQSQLCWQVENATGVSIAPGIGTVDPSGCRTVNPTATTTYVLTATNLNGPVTASATLTVGTVRILTFTNIHRTSPRSRVDR